MEVKRLCALLCVVYIKHPSALVCASLLAVSYCSLLRQRCSVSSTTAGIYFLMWKRGFADSSMSYMFCVFFMWLSGFICCFISSLSIHNWRWHHTHTMTWQLLLWRRALIPGRAVPVRVKGSRAFCHSLQPLSPCFLLLSSRDATFSWSVAPSLSAWQWQSGCSWMTTAILTVSAPGARPHVPRSNTHTHTC